MRKLLIVLLLLPSCLIADWELEQTAEGHWISTQNRAQHRFVADHEQGEIHFFLILTVPRSMTTVPSRATFSIDRGPGITIPLTLVKKRPGNLALRLKLDETQKDKLIAKLVAGLSLEVDFGQKQKTYFSLMGYTAAFSDLLIADDIGRLDAFWLTSHGKQRELACYQMATLSVQAMTARIQGKRPHDTTSLLHQHRNLVIHDAVEKIVNWAYSIPENDLPRIPSTEKYGIFKRCMTRNASTS